MRTWSLCFLSLVSVACGSASPEIWLDLSPVDLGVHDPGGDIHPFSLQVGNRGGGDLTLERVALYHDERCTMEVEGPDAWELSEGHEALFRGEYTPPAEPGVDVAVLVIDSDDPELARLLVPICAAVDDPDAEEPLDPGDCVLPEEDIPDCAGRDPILGENPA